MLGWDFFLPTNRSVVDSFDLLDVDVDDEWPPTNPLLEADFWLDANC